MKRFIIFGLSMVLFSSCIQEVLESNLLSDSTASGQSVPLELSLAVDTLESKAIITSSVLPSGSKVGVHLVDGSSSGLYNGRDYSNVLYTYTSGQMTTSEEVMLTPTSGSVYAYYPYVEDADITSLPISIASQTDYMYAVSISDRTNENYTASLKLKHAMAVVSFNIVKGNYSGACKVTDVAVKGSNIFTSGNYNGMDGSILSRGSSDVFVSSSEGWFIMNTSGTTRNVILIPTPYGNSVTAKIVLDGYARTVSIPSFFCQAGKRCTYTLTVNDSEIVVSNVTVDPWVENNSQYNVYITGNTKDIAINQQVNEDGSITITAIPLLPIEVLNNVTITGSVTKSVKALDRAKVISLSSIKSDVYLSFNGLTKNYVVYKYFYPSSYTGNIEFWDSNASMPTVKLFTVNGIEGTRSMSSSGLLNKELEVKVWYETLSSDILPKNWFGASFLTNVRGSYLSYWEIPEGIVSTEGSEFGTYLSAHLKFPKSLKTINNNSFRNTKVPGVEFHPDSEVTIGKQAFYSSQVSSVQFPKKMTFSFGEQFTNCPFSGKLTIPTWNLLASQYGDSRFRYTDITALVLEEGITNLSPSAYYGYNFADCTSLQSVDLPSTLTLLGCYEFKGCTSLSRITSRATIAPTVQTSSGYRTFQGVKSGGQLIVPEGATGYQNWLNAGLSGWTIIYSSDL